MLLHCRTVFLLLVALLLPASLAVASPREDLLRFVPGNVGFCLVVQDLRDHLNRLADSPLVRKWLDSPGAKEAFDSPEWLQLVRLEKFLAGQFGLGWKEIRDDIVGDAFLFAYRPGPPGKPEQEQGLFLLHARSEKALSRLVSKINAIQQTTGEIKLLETVEYRGLKYTRRREARSTSCYLLRGKVILFTAQEEFLRQAIDAESSAAPVSPLAQRFSELQLDRALVGLAINPRAWDGEIAARATAGDEGARNFASCWKAIDAVGLGVFLDRDIQVALTIKARGADLPPAVRRLLKAGEKPSELWNSVPDGAMLAAAGRFDLSAIHEVLTLFVSRSSTRELEGELDRTLGAMLGKNVIKDVLPAVGPDWGICLVAPASDSKRWAPDLWVAVRIAPGDDSDPVDQALVSMVLGWVRLAVLTHNKQHPGSTLALKLLTFDGTRVQSLLGEGVFPPGLQPVLALRGGYLILAGSPTLLARIKPGPFAGTDAVPLARVSLRELRLYLKEQREMLATVLANKEGVTREQVLAKLDDLRASLEWFDRLELRQTSGSGMVTFTLALQPAAPLRK